MEVSFRPTAGAYPPEVVGRSGVLDEFAHGLRIRSGAPEVLTIFTGARAVGKTVMLGTAEDLARTHGGAVVPETATPRSMGRIGNAMHRRTDELGDGPRGRQARRAAEATGGYPFLTQLVGYFLWQKAAKASAEVTDAMVEQAVAPSRRRNDRVVSSRPGTAWSASTPRTARTPARGPKVGPRGASASRLRAATAARDVGHCGISPPPVQSTSVVEVSFLHFKQFVPNPGAAVFLRRRFGRHHNARAPDSRGQLRFSEGQVTHDYWHRQMVQR